VNVNSVVERREVRREEPRIMGGPGTTTPPQYLSRPAAQPFVATSTQSTRAPSSRVSWVD